MTLLDGYNEAIRTKNATKAFDIAVELASVCECSRLCDLCKQRLRESSNLVLEEVDNAWDLVRRILRCLRPDSPIRQQIASENWPQLSDLNKDVNTPQ